MRNQKRGVAIRLCAAIVAVSALASCATDPGSGRGAAASAEQAVVREPSIFVEGTPPPTPPTIRIDEVVNESGLDAYDALSSALNATVRANLERLGQFSLVPARSDTDSALNSPIQQDADYRVSGLIAPGEDGTLVASLSVDTENGSQSIDESVPSIFAIFDAADALTARIVSYFEDQPVAVGSVTFSGWRTYPTDYEVFLDDASRGTNRSELVLLTGRRQIGIEVDGVRVVDARVTVRPDDPIAVPLPPPRLAAINQINRTKGWEIGSPGGRFTYAMERPETLGPPFADAIGARTVVALSYATAVRRNQFSLEWEPALARRFDVAEDGRSVVITLKEDLRWSDGAALTTTDFVEAVKQVYLAEDVGSSERSRIVFDGAESEWTRLNDLQFRIQLPVPYAGLLGMASIPPLPMHIVGPLLDQGGPSALRRYWSATQGPSTVVSNGAFVVTDAGGEAIQLEANPHYWEQDAAGQQLPYLEAITLLHGGDQGTDEELFEAGITDAAPVNGTWLDTLMSSSAGAGSGAAAGPAETSIYNVGPSFATEFVAFNQNPSEGSGDAGIQTPELTWLSNREFRQAIAHLVNRQAIIDGAVDGLGYPQFSFVPRSSPYYWGGVDSAAYDYRPARAAELLDQIGYVDRDGDGVREDESGVPIRLEIITNQGNQVREHIMMELSDAAASIGIDIRPRPVEFSELVNSLLETGVWNIAVIGMTGAIDPLDSADTILSSGAFYLTEPRQQAPRRPWEQQLTREWVRAGSSLDERTRTEAWRNVQRIWLEEVPVVYTFNRPVIAAYRAKWRNVYPQPLREHGFRAIAHRMYQVTR